MDAMLTDLAILIRGPLTFLLGLGGMYTTVRALMTALMTLPTIDQTRASVTVEAKRRIRELRRLAIISIVLFAVAVWLYLGGPINSIDADELRSKAVSLTQNQQVGVAALIVIAVAIALIEFRCSFLRHRLANLPQKK